MASALKRSYYRVNKLFLLASLQRNSIEVGVRRAATVKELLWSTVTGEF